MDIVFQDSLEQRMVWPGGLDYYDAGFIPSSCTATYLCDELISTFISPAVRKVKHAVAINNSHPTTTIGIPFFANHLCTDKNIRFTFFDLADDCFVPVIGPGCVQIHALNNRVREM